MSKNDDKIIIVGGNAAGAAAAANAKKLYPSKQVLLIEKSSYISTGTCEIPLVISGLLSKDKIIFFNPSTFKEQKGVDVLLNTQITSIDIKNKTVALLNHNDDKISYLNYDKLIIATGSNTNLPEEFIGDYKNLFFIKNITELDKLQHYLSHNTVKSVGIIGSGFIALETAEAFRKIGKQVNIYQSSNYPPLLKDNDLNAFVLELLKKNDINYFEYKKIDVLQKDNFIKSINIDGNIYHHDIIILATGFKPNSDLAVNSNLKLSVNDSIFTNNYLQTSEKDIFAAGDCTHYYDFFNQRPIYLPYASLARFSAYTATKNLYSYNEIFPPVIKNTVFKIFGYVFALVGLDKKEQKERNIYTKEIKVWHENKIHIMFDKLKNFVKLDINSNNKIIGAYLIGGEETSELANHIVTFIKNKLSYKKFGEINYNYAPNCSNMINIMYKISKM